MLLCIGKQYWRPVGSEKCECKEKSEQEENKNIGMGGRNGTEG